MITSKRSRLFSIFAAMLLAFSLFAVGAAEARMGGSFGSRGARTYTSAPATTTSPFSTSPIQNSMTKPGTTGSYGTTTGGGFGQSRGGFWSGLGGGLLGGLLFSGLFGSMFGMGFGGFGGGFFSIIQIVLLIWGISWLMRRFRGRQATAGGYGSPFSGQGYDANQGTDTRASGYGQTSAPVAGRSADEIGIGDRDLATFEHMLQEVQAAFTNEDHAALRRLTTPEMVSFLSEELAQNAAGGVRNEVSGLRFIRGDIAEAWREGAKDYATVAMKWSAIDVLRDRTSGQVTKGDERNPVEATELWTFVRDRGGDWQLSAIQEAARG